jgi:hypothetical protein
MAIGDARARSGLQAPGRARRHNTAQHSTTQHNTAQHSTTQHNTTQHNTTQHNTTQHNTTQHNTTQHSTTQHNTAQHNTAQHSTTADVGRPGSCTIDSRPGRRPGRGSSSCTEKIRPADLTSCARTSRDTIDNIKNRKRARMPGDCAGIVGRRPPTATTPPASPHPPAMRSTPLRWGHEKWTTEFPKPPAT